MSAVARSRARAAARDHALFVLLPIALTIWLLLHVHAWGIAAVDFRNDFRVAGLRLLRGEDLYAWTNRQLLGGMSFPYPAATAVLFVPFALLGADFSSALFTALCLLSALGALWALSVRDWRLYGLVLIWLPVVVGWQTANLSLPLAFGAALVWRCRERAWVAGLLTALLASAKPIMFPLVLWLLATRRYRASGSALAVAAAANLAAWTLVGFGGLPRWLSLLSRQGDLVYRKGYGLVALVADAGLGRGAGTAVEVLAAIALATACWILSRRGSDAHSFTIAIALTVVASPQVDLHYFALLIVPLALARPRLGPCWLVPLLLWACPTDGPAAWQIALAWLLAGGLIVHMLKRPAEPLVAGLRAGVPSAA